MFKFNLDINHFQSNGSVNENLGHFYNVTYVLSIKNLMESFEQSIEGG